MKNSEGGEIMGWWWILALAIILVGLSYPDEF